MSGHGTGYKYLLMEGMFEGITVVPKTANDGKRSYFDQQIYVELKSFIFGSYKPEDKDTELTLPSFVEVVEKVNSFALRMDVRALIVCETLEKIIGEIDTQARMPFFIMSYLCRESVVNTLLRKFNSIFGSECIDLTAISHKIGDNVSEANRVFHSLKICDPSVQGGLFLCTMLNEMVAIKSQMGLLADAEGNPLYQYKFVFDNGTLAVLDKKDLKPVVLDGSTAESRYIQDALFREKSSLINDCLFGVEGDALMVLVAKLRLWTDLIMTQVGSKDADLPCVEANILCGDALISRFTLQEDLPTALKSINQTVSDYKHLLQDIKEAKRYSERKHLTELMTLVKSQIVEGIGWLGRDSDKLLRLRHELAEMMTPGLFPLSEKEAEAINGRILLLQADIKKQEQQISVFRHSQAFNKAIEWRYDFPELLDDKGEFAGFDIMIGVFPDATIAAIGSDRTSIYKRMNYRIYKRTGNVPDLYCELANRLLCYRGCFAYIMSSMWREEPDSSRVGEYLNAEMNPLQLMLFDRLATSASYKMLDGKCAIIAGKDINHHHAVLCIPDAAYDPKIVDLETYTRQFATPVFRLVRESDDTEVSASPVITTNADYINITEKIRRLGLLVRNWDVNIYSGVMTGYDEAFVIDGAVRDKLVRADHRNSDIIKPLLSAGNIKRYGTGKPERWLIYVPWHFPLQYDATIKAASERAEQRFKTQYTTLYEYFLNHKDKLTARNAIEVGLGFEWYALQRSGMNNNWDDFPEMKIVWQRNSSNYRFGIDYDGCAVLDDMCFMVGQHLKFLLGVFNSTMGRYMLKDLGGTSPTEAQAGISVVESLSVPVPNGKMEVDMITLVNRRIAEQSRGETERAETEEKIDRLVYDLYNLTEDEVAFVESQIQH